MTQIELIKQEIERLENRCVTAETFAEELLSFIESLEQEPSLPSNLDEAAEKNFETMEVLEHENIFEETHRKIFKAGAKWMAEQGVTKEAVIGMATEEISVNISQQTLDELDLCPGDKVVVQIRKAK